MIDVLVGWLENDQTVTNAVIMALSSGVFLIATLYFIAFFQGRSVEFWPPKIGERPPRSPAATRIDRLLMGASLFVAALVFALLGRGILAPQSGAAAQSAPRPHAIAQVTIEANAGFQNSGIYLKAGEKVVLDPNGRINLAMLQNSTFLSLAKAITAFNLPQTDEYRQYRENHLQGNPALTAGGLNNAEYLKTLTQGEVFRRDWLDVRGERIDSLDLNPCLLFQGNAEQAGTWGMLLAQVMGTPGAATVDPFIVLTENGLTTADLVPIIGQDFVFEATEDGWLTFIVNDAVLSSDGLPERKACADYQQALLKASSILKYEDDTFRIPEASIPLTWYADNLGSFHVVVKPPDASAA